MDDISQTIVSFFFISLEADVCTLIPFSSLDVKLTALVRDWHQTRNIWRPDKEPIHTEYPQNIERPSETRVSADDSRYNTVHYDTLLHTSNVEYLGPLLLTWIDFTPSMDKQLHPL